MVADIKREIQKAYGIEHPDAARLFLIDANGIVRHQVVNDRRWAVTSTKCAYGRRPQFHEEHGEVCPAQWEKERRYGRLSGRRCKIPTENVSSL